MLYSQKYVRDKVSGTLGFDKFKEKADEMSSEQIDDAFEKVESVSYEQAIAYDEDLEDYLKKQ